MKVFFKLFLIFAKIGLFTFGGGYAMLPMIEEECVKKHKWITSEEFASLVVLADSTPGPVAINCATFIGCRQKGILGSVCATLGMIFPSFVIIYIISIFFDKFSSLHWVSSAFKGIKAAVAILIIDAAIRLFKKVDKKPLPICVAIISFGAMLAIDIFSLHISSIVILITAAATGLIIYFATRKQKEGGQL